MGIPLSSLLVYFILMVLAVLVSFRFPLIGLLLISVVQGWTLGPLCAAYVAVYANGLWIVIAAAGVTLGIFGVLNFYAMYIKHDFSAWGGFLFSILCALIVFSFIGLFFPMAAPYHLLLSCAGVVIFSGYVLFDVNSALHASDSKTPAQIALALYLDIVNIFLNLLNLLNIFSRTSEETGTLMDLQQVTGELPKIVPTKRNPALNEQGLKNFFRQKKLLGHVTQSMVLFGLK